ncbi:hypothetical protein O3P69_009158 [Scylla paramamosain]|uniref:Ionotropic glutamate receptor C-terminal domain-containing protein n=1 Tax=Scylla paramamosain TaxID=85552 RepID=A0AAW0T9C4_SCYPA
MVAYDMEYLCFVNPVPGPLPQWMALGLPFLLETWVATMVTVAAGMLLFTLVARIGYVMQMKVQMSAAVDELDAAGPVAFLRRRRAARGEDWFLVASNSSLLLFACVMNAAWCRVPRSQHLRLFVAVWSVAFIILAVAYKGSLVSHLTVPKEQAPLDTHRQLYEKSVAVGSIGYTLQRVMEKNADPYVRRLAERYTHVPSTQEGLFRTLKVNYTDGKGRPSLHAMREYIAPFGIGLAYPKFVPYVARFNRVIRMLTEAGLAKKWLTDIILDSKRAKLNEGVQP